MDQIFSVIIWLGRILCTILNILYAETINMQILKHKLILITWWQTQHGLRKNELNFQKKTDYQKRQIYIFTFLGRFLVTRFKVLFLNILIFKHCISKAKNSADFLVRNYELKENKFFKLKFVFILIGKKSYLYYEFNQYVTISFFIYCSLNNHYSKF